MKTSLGMRPWVAVLLTVLSALLAACGSESPPEEVVENNAVSIDTGPSLYRAGNRFGWGGEDPFVDEVLPVFAKRCASCHGCIDSPCQLKLTSYEGIKRGAIAENVFSTRLWADESTRMEDHRETLEDGTVDYARTEDGWRNRGFYSVTNGGEQSVMAQLLDPAHELTPDGGLSRALELYENGLRQRDFECVGEQAATSLLLHDDILAPRAMPFGCPRLDDEHFETLSTWLRDGAPGPSKETEVLLAQSSSPDTVDLWEAFFNQEGPKASLVSRYLYEHMFFARIHFDDAPGEFYQLVRSWTAPGEPIQEVVTPHPNDGPEVVAGGAAAAPGTRIYYRLRKHTAVIVHKDHVTWHLDDAVMARWQELFFDPAWGPFATGSYANHNVFQQFEGIPSMIRAQFLVENSLPIIDAMARGDVCHGSTATYAIRDHFWVWFLDPQSDPSAHDPSLGLNDWKVIAPAGLDVSATVRGERRLLQAFEKRLRQLRPEGLGVDDIWKGDGTNPNAMVTVLRHGKSASAHLGAFNGDPETYWVLSYLNFERLYYSLVVNYSPWGSVSVGYETWELMSYARAAGEDLFISMLPQANRQAVRDEWTSGFGRAYQDTFFYMVADGRPSRTMVDDARPASDLSDQIIDYLGPDLHTRTDSISSPAWTLDTIPSQLVSDEDVDVALSTLTAREAPFAQYFPNLTLVRVSDPERIYTIVANRAYASHDHLLLEGPARQPERDTLSVNRGIVGSYPELFIDLRRSEVRAFLQAVYAIDSERGWAAFVDAHAPDGEAIHLIPRTSSSFWSFLDDLHDRSVREDSVRAGILDVSEYVWPSLVDPAPLEGDDAYEPNDDENSARPLELGTHRLVICNDDAWELTTSPQDWFSLELESSGKLAVEVVFEEGEGDVDVVIEGPGGVVASQHWSGSFEAITLDATPGTYRVGIEKLWSGCQRYTLFATLHP